MMLLMRNKYIFLSIPFTLVFSLKFIQFLIDNRFMQKPMDL